MSRTSLGLFFAATLVGCGPLGPTGSETSAELSGGTYVADAVQAALQSSAPSMRGRT